MIKEFYISSQKRYELVDITSEVEQLIKKGRIENGLILIFVPHSTAAIVLTESEPGLKSDWLAVLKKLVSGIDFLHNQIDNNADSHILSGLLGQEKILAVENGKLVLGTWQQIFLAEFDGPRKRRIIIKIIS